ncbi:uncharacterized protein LOC107368544 isoform X2 [Tetranychus urticae]|uniref:uncharacterized protein LOC107368544 isoform X2 n=1 Tax=Tetranychus urticae TaxID=32264 RepID=UPI00077BDFA7|nr:uncharacterized protein LOC107368544 isoform X2 [Tetranychus urticae]
MANSVWVMIKIPAKTPELNNQIIDSKKSNTNSASNYLAPPGIEEKKKEPIEPSIQTILEKTLEELEINNAVWIKNTDGTFFHVYFACDVDDSDSIIHHMQIQGIGSLPQTFIGIIPFTLAYQSEEDADVFLDDTTDQVDSDTTKKQSSFKAMQEKLLKSVTARLTVAQVVASVQSNSELTFDFVCYVLCAAWLAALGLMESDVVTLVASMLVSPLMGPVMAMTFGLIVRDQQLRNLGVRNAIIGFALTIVFGFFYGCIVLNFAHEYNPTTVWPSQAMRSRGQLRALWVGALVALPSGAAVAVSLLSGNQASLVGVAISASLLPPCVNAGLLWAFSTIKAIKSLSEDWINVNNVTFTKPSLVLDPSYEVSYSTNFSYECFWLGLGSLGLASVNVACILLMSWILLKIKEVSPVDEKSSPTSRFWKEDVKIVREYNKTVRERKRSLHQDFLQEWAEMNGLDPQELLSENPEARAVQMATLRDMVKDVEEDEVFQQILMNTRPNADYIRKVSMATIEPLRFDGTKNKSASNVSIDMENRDLKFQRRSIALPSPSARSFLGNQTGDLSPHNSRRGTRSAKNSVSTLSMLNQPTTETGNLQRRQSTALLRKSLRNSDHSPYSLWPRRSSEAHRMMAVPPGHDFGRRSRKIRSTGEFSDHD